MPIGYYPGFFLDPTLLLILPGIFLALWAQTRVKSTYRKYSKISSSRNVTAAQVARDILDRNDLAEVKIQMIQGNLTDHYNPATKTLSLSQDVYRSTSIAAIGIAAHETGHALQHSQAYTAMQIRSAIVPVANFGSFLSWPILLFGLMFSNQSLIFVGIGLFFGVVLFQLVTLPVEFNASSRALITLNDFGYLYPDEIIGAKKVLNAAALTYLAAALGSILQLLRLILLSGMGRRRD